MKQTKPMTIEAYIQAQPDPVRTQLEAIRGVIASTVPEAKEAMRYGMPTFRLDGKNLVHFAAHTNHIGFYPTPSAIEAFMDELASYKSSKGAVQFPLTRQLPLALIRKMVLFRAREQRSG